MRPRRRARADGARRVHFPGLVGWLKYNRGHPVVESNLELKAKLLLPVDAHRARAS